MATATGFVVTNKSITGRTPLVQGDSFAWHMARRDNNPGVTVLGRRGATLQDEAFRRWVLQEAARHRPDTVMLIVGGNDLAAPTFRLRSFIALNKEIVAELLATGTPEVIFMPILQRVSRWSQDASAKQHRRRRKPLNLALHQRFVAAPPLPKGDGPAVSLARTVPTRRR